MPLLHSLNAAMNDEHQSIERTVIIGLDASEQSRDALALGRLLAETPKATPSLRRCSPTRRSS